MSLGAYGSRLFARTLVTLIAGLPRVLSAEEGQGTFELSWVAPPSCPQVAELRAEVERLVGADAPPGRRLSARGTVAQENPGEWKVVVMTRLDGVEGERIISGATCSAVSDAAVLTLALTLSPDLRPPTAAPAVPPQETGPVAQPSARQQGPRLQPSTPPVRRARLAGPESESPLRTQWLGRAAAGLRVGTLPKPQPELSAGLGVARGRFLGWVVGAYALAQSIDAPAKPNVARVWAGSATALGCYQIVVGTVGMAPCGGFELTGVWGRGGDIANPQRDALYWVSPVLGFGAGYRLGRLVGVRLEGLGMAPFRRPAGLVTGLDRVYRPGPAAGRVCVGIELTTP